jgi:hypothetical protein
MDRHIGLDAHTSSCPVAVVGPSGLRLTSPVVEICAGALVSAIAAIPQSRGPKSDKRDAIGLAEMLRIGANPHKIYKQRGRFAQLA